MLPSSSNICGSWIFIAKNLNYLHFPPCYPSCDPSCGKGMAKLLKVLWVSPPHHLLSMTTELIYIMHFPPVKCHPRLPIRDLVSSRDQPIHGIILVSLSLSLSLSLIPPLLPAGPEISRATKEEKEKDNAMQRNAKCKMHLSTPPAMHQTRTREENTFWKPIRK